MKIVRKILRVKTVGSRETHDLRPKIADELPRGVNLLVLEYSPDDIECVVEMWGSDHEALVPEEKITSFKVASVLEKASVIDELSSHPKSPIVLGRIQRCEEERQEKK